MAEALDIHPFMLSRWRKEYREGELAMKRDNKMRDEAKKLMKDRDETNRLKRRIAELQEENDILKKFQRFQAEERRKRSDSSGNTEDNTE